MTVAEMLRRNRKITSTTSAMDRSSVNLTSLTESRIGHRAVVEHVEVDRRRQLRPEGGQELLDRVDHLDGVGAGLALDGEDDGALVVVPARHLVRLHAVDDAAELLEPHRRAVAVGDDQRAIGGGVGELPARLDAEGLVRPRRACRWAG